MDDTTPVARSAISPAPPEIVVACWAVSGRRSTGALTLTDASPLAKVAVRADPDGELAQALGVRFGRTSRRTDALDSVGTDVLVVGSGPGEWLALGAPGRQLALTEQLRGLLERPGRVSGAASAELVTVVDLTHGRALMRLTGPAAAELLGRECAVDLTDAACPDGSALRTAVAGLATDVIRDDWDGTSSYLLHCERSSGQYLFDSLLDAGTELGVDVDGFTTPSARDERRTMYDF
jgi:heterotetrameric sarcosine oxidase gamma subunit